MKHGKVETNLCILLMNWFFFLTLKLDFKYQPINIFFYRHQRDRKWTYELWKNLKICYLVYNLEYQGGVFFLKLKQNKSRNKQNTFHFFIIHGMCNNFLWYFSQKIKMVLNDILWRLFIAEFFSLSAIVKGLSTSLMLQILSDCVQKRMIQKYSDI